MTFLLIADPPHGRGELADAARLLDLAPVELRLKTNYPVPEVWHVAPDPAAADTAAAVLRAAGLRIGVAPGEALPALPDPVAAQRFALDAHGVRLEGGDGEETVDPDQRLTLVSFTARPPVPPGVPGAPFTDLYWLRDGGVRCWRVEAGATDFAGLGVGKSPSAAGNVRRFAGECARVLPRAEVDERCLNMQLRLRPAQAAILPADAPKRKGYSYASPGLEELLARLRPGLEEIAQADLASRLAFLSSRLRA